MYKTPIVPGWRKNAKVIPEFLRSKKAHVRVSMTKKGRSAKSSLSLSDKRLEAEKTGGRPYEGMGNLSRLLAKRKAEEEETLRSADADEVIEESPSKRDIGVSAKLTFES